MSLPTNRKRRHSEEDETNSRPKQPATDDIEVDDNVVSKALEALREEFKEEIKGRAGDLEEVNHRLREALRIQHLLRYAIISSYYGVRTSLGEWPDASNSKQIVHPSIAVISRKKKTPKRIGEEKSGEGGTCDSDGPSEEKGNVEGDAQVPTKIPCYIPPTTKKSAPETTSPTRGFHTKKKYCIIVGNVSRWIPVDCREDGASHKWMVYARCPPGDTPISHFVSKVRFFLHASYRPFDVVEAVSPPFRISRRGWGEFPIRVQVHFSNPLNKPIDIIHHLVLDKTKSGRQALGGETVVQGWMFVDDDRRSDNNQDAAGETWDRSSREDLDDDSCESDMGCEKRFMGEEGPSNRVFPHGKRPKHYGVLWDSSENVPSVFNECTLMSKEDIKEEAVDEENNSSDDDQVASFTNFSGAVQSMVERDISVTGPKFEERTAVVDQVSIKEEPLSEEEQNVEEEVVLDHNLGNEEVVFCDMTQEVAEEVVIEDGIFPVPLDEVSVVDMSSCHALNNTQKMTEGIVSPSNSSGHSEQPKIPQVKVENTVHNLGDRVSLMSSKPAAQKLPLLLVHGEVKPFVKPTVLSNSAKGPPKGTSLLKNPSIRPGTSLLIQLPSATGTARTTLPPNLLAFKSLSQTSHQPNVTPTIKLPADTKSAIFSRNYSKLKTRIHEDQEAAASHLLRSLPIITSLGCDPAYRALHQYAANSLDEFFSWPLAKQRASEWIRAGEVRKLLSAQGFSNKEDNAWTTKDIMMWARLRGYTPLSPKVPHAPLHFNTSEENSSVALDTTATFSEPKKVLDWLSSCENEKSSAVKETDDIEIDVENVGGPPKKSTSVGSQKIGLGARAAAGQKVILLGMEQSMGDLSRLVDEFSRKIGVTASCPEEIVPCVFYPAAQRVLSEAVKSFVNDLVRGSYSYALKRSSESSGAPTAITVEDVRNAVLNRQEFDILTNEGLSTEPDDSMKWDGAV